MAENLETNIVGSELTDRERRVLEAVIRIYVETAEPAGSRTVARRSELGVSPATVRNTMSDLEEKGYLMHPHTSAGRVPTDLAYRFYVDQLIQPTTLSRKEQDRLVRELEREATSAAESLVRRATRALGILSTELGVALAPRLDDAVLERLDLIQVSSSKIMLVATIRSGFVRTVYVDLPGEVPGEALVDLTLLLNERLAGLNLREIRETLPERIRGVATSDEEAEQLINIFMQSGVQLFESPELEGGSIHLGRASVLANQPEFTTGEGLKGLLELTERTELLAEVLEEREHPGGLRITIGGEHAPEELSGFTLVTGEYSTGGLRGVIGVIGPTRMPYDKVVAIVDYTSSLVTRILEGR